MWERIRDDCYRCRVHNLMIERSPDDGWWYIYRTDEYGEPLSCMDVLGWAETCLGAAKVAQDLPAEVILGESEAKS